MDIDYRQAFDLAPVGLALSRNRAIVDCNAHLCEMFGVSRDQLLGQSFQVLYPSADEFERTGERIAPILNRSGTSRHCQRRAVAGRWRLWPLRHPRGFD